MLNVERLRALHAVAEKGSILAAADSLHVTTSAVSQQLAKLEREVGRRLLEKQGRGVRLTDAGRLLVTHTEQVLCMLEQAEAELDAGRDTVTGRLLDRRVRHGLPGLAPRRWAACAPRIRNCSRSCASSNRPTPCRCSCRRDLDMAIIAGLGQRAAGAARRA